MTTHPQIYLNRTQLARRLSISPETLRKRISAGKIKPDAMDGYGRDLFRVTRHPARITRRHE